MSYIRVGEAGGPIAAATENSSYSCNTPYVRSLLLVQINLMA